MLSRTARTITVPHEKLAPQHERWIPKAESFVLAVVLFLCFGLVSCDRAAGDCWSPALISRMNRSGCRTSWDHRLRTAKACKLGMTRIESGSTRRTVINRGGGIQSQGNAIIRWGNKEMFKHLIGFTLFSALCTMLLALGAFWLHPFLFLVFSFIIS